MALLDIERCRSCKLDYFDFSISYLICLGLENQVALPVQNREIKPFLFLQTISNWGYLFLKKWLAKVRSSLIEIFI